jgi:hypothetical protein
MKFSKGLTYKISDEFDNNDSDLFSFAEQGESGSYFHRYVYGDKNVIDDNLAYFNNVEIADGVLVEVAQANERLSMITFRSEVFHAETEDTINEFFAKTLAKIEAKYNTTAVEIRA